MFTRACYGSQAEIFKVPLDGCGNTLSDLRRLSQLPLKVLRHNEDYDPFGALCAHVRMQPDDLSACYIFYYLIEHRFRILKETGPDFFNQLHTIFTLGKLLLCPGKNTFEPDEYHVVDYIGLYLGRASALVFLLELDHGVAYLGFYLAEGFFGYNVFHF